MGKACVPYTNEEKHFTLLGVMLLQIAFQGSLFFPESSERPSCRLCLRIFHLCCDSIWWYQGHWWSLWRFLFYKVEQPLSNLPIIQKPPENKVSSLSCPGIFYCAILVGTDVEEGGESFLQSALTIPIILPEKDISAIAYLEGNVLPKVGPEGPDGPP